MNTGRCNTTFGKAFCMSKCFSCQPVCLTVLINYLTLEKLGTIEELFSSFSASSLPHTTSPVLSLTTVPVWSLFQLSTNFLWSILSRTTLLTSVQHLISYRLRTSLLRASYNFLFLEALNAFSDNGLSSLLVVLRQFVVNLWVEFYCRSRERLSVVPRYISDDLGLLQLTDASCRCPIWALFAAFGL